MVVLCVLFRDGVGRSGIFRGGLSILFRRLWVLEDDGLRGRLIRHYGIRVDGGDVRSGEEVEVAYGTYTIETIS
jgi:hypothetical protein